MWDNWEDLQDVLSQWTKILRFMPFTSTFSESLH